MEIKEKKGDLAAVEYIRRLSPIASQHLNFGGRYEFNKLRKLINIEKILKMMDKIDILPKKRKLNLVFEKNK